MDRSVTPNILYGHKLLFRPYTILGLINYLHNMKFSLFRSLKRRNMIYPILFWVSQKIQIIVCIVRLMFRIYLRKSFNVMKIGFRRFNNWLYYNLVIHVLSHAWLVFLLICAYVCFLCDLICFYMCSYLLFMCSYLLFMCSYLLFMCSYWLFMCSYLLFMCSYLLSMCSYLLFMCSYLLFMCSY